MVLYGIRIACVAILSVFLFLSCNNGSSAKTTTTVVSAVSFDEKVLAEYRAWVLEQGDAFLVAVEGFTAAVLAGDRQKAKDLYAPSRAYYERIEPIAEALGDFDPRLDARDGDVPAAEWRGYHKIEKILWSDTNLSEAKELATTLLADVKLLRAKLETAEITLPHLITGAVELLNEVSTGKVTGEEERYSHTDLWDFQANVEGSEKIYQILRSETEKRNPQLVQTLDQRFEDLLAELALHRKGSGFKYYQELKADEVHKLVQHVDALAEPLAQLGKVFQ